MEKDSKKGLKWRGLATFLLAMGMLIEIISGIVLYITPPGRYANWNNWTLWGLTKGEWGAVHTIFGYVLLIIIGLHLYFNGKVIVHFFWSRVKNTFNLKKELAIAAVVTFLIFAGTLWGIPPFSSVMIWGEDAKNSWETNSRIASLSGNVTGVTSQHDAGSIFTEQKGRGRASSMSGLIPDSSVRSDQAGVINAFSGRGGGRGELSQVSPAIEQAAYSTRGGGYGRKTIEMICTENNISTQEGLSRLRENNISANAGDYIRDIENRTGKSLSEILQVIRDGRITSTHVEGLHEPGSIGTGDNLKGKDYVELGKTVTVSGVLARIGNEWGLDAGNATYEIHMGPTDFMASRGFVLNDGAAAKVTGFVYGSNLSVTVIETGGQRIVLRDETGRPAWSGSNFSRGESSLRTF